jgi:hypothetical protein
MFAARRRKMQEEEARVLKKARQMGEPASPPLSDNEEGNENLKVNSSLNVSTQNKRKWSREYQYTSGDVYNFILDEMTDPLTWKSRNGMPAISVWVYHNVSNSTLTQAVDKIRSDNAVRGYPWKIEVRTEPDGTWWVDFVEDVTGRILSRVSKLKHEN